MFKRTALILLILTSFPAAADEFDPEAAFQLATRCAQEIDEFWLGAYAGLINGWSAAKTTQELNKPIYTMDCHTDKYDLKYIRGLYRKTLQEQDVLMEGGIYFALIQVLLQECGWRK
ncbi:MAG: hypothetical protein ACE5MK_08985 [Acidobacteriota bacterium]